ncbi:MULTISPECIES: hypothetical protein [unclassified Rickettsia]
MNYELLHILDVIPAQAGIQKNYSHPEFISGSTIRDAETSSA